MCGQLANCLENTTPPQTHTLPHSHMHPYTCTLTHSLTDSLTHLLSYSLTHSHTHTLIHPLTHSLTHSLTHTPTHSLTHMPQTACMVSVARNRRSMNIPQHSGTCMYVHACDDIITARSLCAHVYLNTVLVKYSCFCF